MRHGPANAAMGKVAFARPRRHNVMEVLAMRLLKGFLFLLLTGGLCQQAQAWGCEGHRIVAFIAMAHLTPDVARQIDELLRQNPIDPALKRFCGPSADPMADASTWADDIRDGQPLTFPYHFIDIPLGVTPGSYNLEKACPAVTGCLLTALAMYTQQLKQDHDPAHRADALRFLIHFVGDAHQPLHDSDDGDRGGNCVPVTYLAREPRRKDAKGIFTGDYSPNLHSVWDTSILRSMLESKAMKPRDFARYLDSHHGRRAAQWSKTSPAGWVWEGHGLAEKVAYGNLPVKPPLEDVQKMPDCLANNNVSARRLELHEEIKATYQAQAEVVVEDQLEKAGVRLAALLNNSLATPSPKKKWWQR